MESLVPLKVSYKNSVKILVGSLVGICMFFIPFSTQSGDKKIPLVMLIDSIKSFLGEYLDYITLAFILLLCFTWVASKLKSNSRIKSYHRGDGFIIGTLFILAGLFALSLVFHVGPDFILNEDVGGLALYIAGTVLITVVVAGFFAFFITEFGFAEFIGTLLEPIMRPLYRVPGRAAVDAVTSFVASPAVGVFITNKLYKEGKYTQREAASIATNFSVADIGFITVLASIAGVIAYLPQVIFSSFIITFVIAIITTRIPPLSKKLDCYYNGEMRATNEASAYDSRNILTRAWCAASERAALASPDVAWHSLWNAIKFAQKIVAYVLAIATLVLALATYTSVFNYLGIIFEPLLNVLALPDVAKISPAILISITEVALPSIIVSSGDVALMSAFFICTLSIVQIIFFTESANAMLEADIPLTVWDLILIFLIRTVIAIPLVAASAHIVF